MNIKNRFTMAWLIAALSASNIAFAYTDDKPEELCKAPKFKGFNLPVYSADNKVEVAPEAEFSFTVSGWTDPETLLVTAKNEPLVLAIENKMSFFRIKTKLPASLNGKFVRINARARAVLGCKSEAGWLLKVAAANDTATPASTTEVSTVPKAAAEKAEAAVVKDPVKTAE